MMSMALRTRSMATVFPRVRWWGSTTTSRAQLIRSSPAPPCWPRLRWAKPTGWGWPSSQATRPAKPSRPPCTRSSQACSPSAGWASASLAADRSSVMAGRSTWSGWRTTWISGTPRRYRPLGARVRGELASSVVVSRTMPGSGAGQSGRPSTAAGRRPRTAAGRARLTAERLAVEDPGTAAGLCELDVASPWQLLVATVLSAQTTDERVNAVTPGLFARFPEPEDLAVADSGEVEALIRPTGFFRVKAKNIVALAQALCDRF